VTSEHDILSTAAIVGIAVGGATLVGVGSYFAITSFFPKAGGGFILLHVP